MWLSKSRNSQLRWRNEEAQTGTLFMNHKELVRFFFNIWSHSNRPLNPSKGDLEIFSHFRMQCFYPSLTGGRRNLVCGISLMSWLMGFTWICLLLFSKFYETVLSCRFIWGGLPSRLEWHCKLKPLCIKGYSSHFLSFATFGFERWCKKWYLMIFLGTAGNYKRQVKNDRLLNNFSRTPSIKIP